MGRKFARFILFFSPYLVAFVNYSLLLFSNIYSYIDFSLIGDEYLEIPIGESYEEQGFVAARCFLGHCEDVSEFVTIENSIPSETLGNFSVTYSLNLPMKRGSATLTREVHIIDNIPPVVTLNGDPEITLFVGDDYIEPGFSATDNFDGDLTEKVETGTNLDLDQPGEYLIKYVVEDSSGNAGFAERTVIVKNRIVYTPAVPTTFAPSSINTFDDLRDLIIARGYDISFGFFRLDGTYTYLHRPDDLYYGASLIKAIDGMYAYEMTTPTAYQKTLLKNAIAYSYNDAHKEYVNSVGFDNIHAYCASLGSRYCLNGSVLIDNVSYFSDTTVNDQILLWRHLYDLIRNPVYGEELKSYYVNMSWSDVAFIGAPTHLHKAGILETGYHATSLFLAPRPYILVLLSNENYRPNRTAIFKELSSYVYNIQFSLP